MRPIRRYAPLGIGSVGIGLAIGGIVAGSLYDVGTAPAVAITLVGFTTLALATSLYVHDRVETFQRERPLAILLVFLGVGVATLGAGFDLSTETTIGTAGLGIAMVAVGYAWNRRLIRAKEVITRDERVDALAYKSGHRAHQLVMLAVSAGVFLVSILGVDSVPVGTSGVLLGLLVLGVASRIGFYRYYARRE